MAADGAHNCVTAMTFDQGLSNSDKHRLVVVITNPLIETWRPCLMSLVALRLSYFRHGGNMRRVVAGGLPKKWHNKPCGRILP